MNKIKEVKKYFFNLKYIIIDKNLKEGKKGFNPANYTVSEPKSIPVVLLLDRSGSMSGEKIDKLNEAVRIMID